MPKKLIFILFLIALADTSFGQTLSGYVLDAEKKGISQAKIELLQTEKVTFSAKNGFFQIRLDSIEKEVTFSIQAENYEEKIIKVTDFNNTLQIELTAIKEEELEEVVISGNLKEVSKSNSAIPIEVYSARYFCSNPNPTVFDALQNINGVRPQLNCNICNTGDIHVNGLEGPYTMILIDGMPIVSGLSTVYGLSGIPTSLIDRVEIVKGPASTLYGSEAIGGVINVITKKVKNAPILSADIFGTSWAELSADIGTKFNVGKKASSLLGVNYYNFQLPIDKNKDGFTDVTQQHRIAIFNKWNFERKQQRIFSIAARYLYEDRWGGETNWNKSYRGGTDRYAESIYTNRWELLGTYQLPVKEKILFQWSANGHYQNSYYGSMSFQAQQTIGYGQLLWYKTIKKHDLLAGATYRVTAYDDNTVATQDSMISGGYYNVPSLIQLPGLFVQDEITFSNQHKLLIGARYDYNSIHGSIVTPRLNYKWNSKDAKHIVRVSVGNGYRVASVFTEDHAALTGARKVIFTEELKPEQSWNANLNYVQNFKLGEKAKLNLDWTAFYTHFSNKIIPDYLTNPNQIIYENLDGHAVSRGISANINLSTTFGLTVHAGATLMDVFSIENEIKERQLFTERFTGTWTISYEWKKIGLTIDYTGNVYSPMKLPLASELDPRPEYSPWWSIQNIQFRKRINTKFEIYAGVKNLLNWTPNKGIPFLIARAFDPFDKNVQFDSQGNAMATATNPYGLTFDPAYVYGPNQGIRFFAGIRITIP